MKASTLRVTRSPKPSNDTAPRIGLFGLLGSGNFGNDASLEAVLAYLRAQHPDAILECLCPGPDEVTARYGIAATRLNWYRAENQTASSLPALAAKAFGKLVDAFRIMSWVRRFDAILVPGSGILESALTVRPWERPYALFLVCAFGRLCRTKVALVSVGASVTAQPITRWLLKAAARCAHYRSFRDTLSRDAMRTPRAATGGDPVYPDLVFALPTPANDSGSPESVGVGVMAYYGGNEDRKVAQDIYSAYVDKIKAFVRWLVDDDRRVLLFTGDHVDESVTAEIVADARAHRPDLDPSRVVAAPICSLDGLMQQMSSVDTVVATRYHNVLCALKMAKPTLSVGYAAKNDALMSDMGLAEFCQSARALDVALLIRQFRALELRRDAIRRELASKNLAAACRLDQQFELLSVELLSAVRRRSGRSCAPSRMRRRSHTAGAE